MSLHLPDDYIPMEQAFAVYCWWKQTAPYLVVIRTVCSYFHAIASMVGALYYQSICLLQQVHHPITYSLETHELLSSLVRRTNRFARHARCDYDLTCGEIE